MKTPMSALGLPQSVPRATATRQEDQLRRRQKTVATSLAVVVFICCVVLISEMLMWTQTPSLQTTDRKVEKQLQIRAQEEARLHEERIREKKNKETMGFRDEKKIVLLMTNYRDSHLCASSLVEAMENAFLASRVHLRVFDEIHIGYEPSCIDTFCDIQPELCKKLIRTKQLQFAKRDASGASGITIANYLVEDLVESEKFTSDFYLAVDSSISFTKRWDLALLKQWYSIGNDMAILSVAPKSLVMQGRSNSTMLLHCSARIHSKAVDGVVEFNAPEPKPKVSSFLGPVLQSQYSELFHFGPISALVAVRSDPHTPHIIVGHEYARASRFWTKGYDFYAPVDDIFYASYEWRPLLGYRSNDNDPAVMKSNRRIRRLLNLPVSFAGEPLVDVESYALGSQRSMAAWIQFSRIYPKAAYNESTQNQFVTCLDHLQYVRYK